MKRYLLFFTFAILLHGLILIPFWLVPQWGPAAVGGGSGASITIAVAPAISASDGRRAAAPQPRAARQAGFDVDSSTHSGSGQGPSAGPGVGTGSGRSGEDEILAEIRQRIERAKRYPLRARRHGLEGTSDVVFLIRDDGNVHGLKLARSSGVASLDEAALATIRRAAPFPFYPQPIQIGIRFSLSK